MTDLSTTIAPKSDQLNADDLWAGPLTIRVRDVQSTGAKEQPVAIFYDGDNDKPFKPGLSMRRVLVRVWGKHSEQYVGRSMTLYRDENVVFGGVKTGGIRISHMSNMDGEITIALAANKASRKPFTVKPLIVDVLAGNTASAVAAIANATPSLAGVEAMKKKAAPLMEKLLSSNRPELHERITDAIKALHARIPQE